MNLSLLLAAAVAVHAASVRTVGNLVLEDIPEIPEEVAQRMLQYQNTRGVGSVELEETGRSMLISTRFGETAQLHWVDRPLGQRRQLTFFKEPVRRAALRPRGRGDIAFLMDEGGSEYTQIHLFRRADGRATMLTDGKSRNQSIVWSRSGRALAYASTERNGRDFDLWRYDFDGGKRQLLAELEGYWAPLDWSPDDSKLLLLRYVSINESYLHVYDLNEKKLSPLLPLDPSRKAAYPIARWAPDGKSVYFASDDPGEFVTLGRLDLASRRIDWISADVPWDVEGLEIAANGSLVAFSVNENGASALYLMKPGGKPRRAALPLGVINAMSFSADGRRLGLSLSLPTAPADAYVLETRSGRLERWTESETGGLPSEKFVAPTLVAYPSFDGRKIPAYYYRPAGEGPFPFVIYIHGGPESQERPEFAASFQYWVNELKLAVLVPNVRGSSGYGKSYLQLDNGYKREDSVKDIGALLDWAQARPELDSSRAAVYGGSYGGYMVLASLARYPDRLKAGVDIVGISNFVTFLTNTKDYRRDLRRVEYGDERDPEMRAFLESISPTNLAKDIRSRLFVIQGANDPRVPASEAEQIVKAVRANGRPVWYLLAKDEGHGFAKKTNRDLMGQAVVLFWQRHLLP